MEMVPDNNEDLDFGTMKISKLYRKIFFPTLIGMIAIIINTLVDGIFVGRGIGSDALAAVNIVAPLFMVVTGVSLMFGVGASVVASIYLSKQKLKLANINITQAFVVATLIMIVVTLILIAFNQSFMTLLGSSELLLPYTTRYLCYLAPSFVFLLIASIGLFVIRLDGSPKYAMLCSVVPAICNMGLNYLFIFKFGWGIGGAALATSIGIITGGVMVLVYVLAYSKVIKLVAYRINIRSLMLTAKNIGYQIKLGSSAMIGELAVSIMMATGNYVFMSQLGEDGVAAFSVACYCYPIVFMLNTAVAMSAQPIISYNHGQQNTHRVSSAFKLMVSTGIICGVLASVLISVFAPEVVSLFLVSSAPAYAIAVKGLPYFSIGFVFFAINMTFIGYFQSTEKAQIANWYSIWRGILLPVGIFLILPLILGVKGIWLAVPAADILMLFVILALFRKSIPLSRCSGR